MKILSFLIISITLLGCEGTETSSDPGTGTELKFTNSEFSEKILFSEELGDSSIQDGFVLRFEETTVKEIGSLSSNGNTALTGEYDWVIENDKLQVTYPSSVVCTTTKVAEDNLEFDTEVICDGGDPNNEKINNGLMKPLSFSKSGLTNKKVTIELRDNRQEILDFNSNGSSFIITKRENGQDSSTQNGTFSTSIYTNTVRLSFPDDEEYSLFVLLDGSLSGNGLLLDLRYKSSDDTLINLRILSIENNDVWRVNKLFDLITIDN